MKLFVLATVVFLNLIAHTQTVSFFTPVNKNNIKQAHVVILAERHADIKSKSFLPELIEQIKSIDNNYNCLSLEYDSNYQTDFLKIKNEQDYKNLSRKMFIDLTHFDYNKASTEQKNVFEENLINYHNEFKYWLFSSQKMQSLGGHVYLTDDIKSLSLDKKTISDRNIFITKNISSLIQNQSCKKFIVIIGAAHTQNQAGTPVNTLLMLYGLKVEVIPIYDLIK